MSLAIRGILIGLVLMVAMSGLRAATIDTLPAGKAPALRFDWRLKDYMPRQDLRQIVNRLQSGNTIAAKRELAAYLQRFPKDAQALELAAVILMGDGKWAAAEESLRRSLAAEPKVPRVMAKLGVVLLFLDRSKAAEEELNKALKLEPTEPIALSYLGWLEGSRGNLELAITLYERLMTSESGVSDGLTRVHLTLADLYNSAGRFQDTYRLLAERSELGDADDLKMVARLSLLEAAIELRRTERARQLLDALEKTDAAALPEVMVSKGVLLRFDGNRTGAEKALKAALKSIPDGPSGLKARVHLELARLLRDADEWDGATRELELAVATTDIDSLPVLLRELTAALVSGGKPEQAIQAIRQQIDKHADLPVLQYLLAEVHVSMGNTDAAVDTLRKLRRRHSSFAPASYLLGLIQWQQGRAADAIAAMREAVAGNPAYVAGWLALAGMQYDRAGPEAMTATLKQGLAANPKQPDLLFRLAELSYDRGDQKEAVAYYRRILNAWPNDPRAMSYLAVILSDSEIALGEARNLIGRAHELAPDDPIVQDAYAWVWLFADGRFSSALVLLQNAAKAQPKDALVHYHLAATYLALGRKADARTAARLALEIGVASPDMPRVRSILSQANAP